MKDNLKTVFMLIGVTLSASAVLIALIAGMNRIGIVPDILRTDPIYGVNIVSKETPQIVYQTKVGDDKIPHRYEVWYNPKTQNYMERIVEVGE